MTETRDEVTCRSCGQPREATTLDRFGWCERCRRVLVARATIAARVVAAVGLAISAYFVFARVDPGPRSLILWIILLLAIYAVLYKVTQRVSFEIFRGRGVKPPES